MPQTSRKGRAGRSTPAAPQGRPRRSIPPPRQGRAGSAWIRAAHLTVWLVPAALAAWYVVPWVIAHGRLVFPMDDPYIHFQFARNLATGGGFSFNAGEPTPGATSPLWVLVLATAHRLGAPLEATALVLGVVATSMSGWMVVSVGRAVRLPEALTFAAAIATVAAGRFTWASLSGMEIALATFLALGVARVQLTPGRAPRRALGLGALCGLATQARPEALLLFPAVVLLEWRGRRAHAPEGLEHAGPALASPREGEPSGAGSPGRAETGLVSSLLLMGAAFAVTVLPYLIFCLATTQRPLPNTFYAKSLLPLFHSGAAVARMRLAYLPDMLRWVWLDSPAIAVLLIPGLLVWRRRPGGPPASLVDVWPLLFWAYALWLCPRHFSLSRYTIPLVPFASLLAMGAVDVLRARARRLRVRRGIDVAVVVVVTATACGYQPDVRRIYTANVENILAMQVRMGEWVATLPETARIATHDIGAITYHGRHYCIDTMGLVSSELIARELAARRGSQPLDAEAVIESYLEDMRPQYCILFPEWHPRLIRRPWMRAIREIRHPNSTGGGNVMVAYQVVAAGRARLGGQAGGGGGR